MTAKYSVKKCNSYGFAQDFDKALKLFKHDELNSSEESTKIFYIGDNEPKEISDINEISLTKSSDEIINEINQCCNPKQTKAIVFIEAGKYKEVVLDKYIKNEGDIDTIKKYVNDIRSNNDDDTLLDDYSLKSRKQIKLDFTNGEIIEIIDILETLYERPDFLKGKEMSPKFYTFIYDIYGILKDSLFKNTLLSMLSSQQIDIKYLLQNYPIEYEQEQVQKIVNTDNFKDIEIICDSKQKGNSSASVYKTSKEDLKQATLGNST